MKIAISGTHCVGKSILIDAFLFAHPEFNHEPEAYEMLQEEYGESFAAEPTAEEFNRQLEYNLKRISSYQSDDLVIFERCPVDYLAYLFALVDLGCDADAKHILDHAQLPAGEAAHQLDIIVFLPASSITMELPDEEDLALRSAVDARLERILLADDLGLFVSGHPLVLEAVGPTTQRLRTLESALAQAAKIGMPYN
jgi:hypothetical protein